MAYKYKEYTHILTQLTAIVRVFISSIFLALFLSNRLGLEALGIFLFDFTYVVIYLIFFYKTIEKKVV